MMTRTSLIAATLAVVLLAACDRGGQTTNSPSPTAPPPVSPTAVASTTPMTPPSPPATAYPTRGETTVDCVNGWITPPEDSPRYLEPLGIIRRTTGVEGPLVVVDMRYFTGPESPPSDKGYIAIVERWYVRLYAEDDPAFRGRFLVEARRFGRGVSAVAAYDTSGWRSPDWIGFQYESADSTPRAYPGLPGLWEGEPYDFVNGGGDLTIPGLPPQIAGCLAGT